MFLIAILIVISSSVVIFTILKDKKLRNVNNLLIVNLLVADLMFILAFTRVMYSIYLVYILILSFMVFVIEAIPFTSFLSRGSTLMAVPLTVYCVVTIIRPLSSLWYQRRCALCFFF